MEPHEATKGDEAASWRLQITVH